MTRLPIAPAILLVAATIAAPVQAALTSGWYRAGEIHVRVAATKANGVPWDVGHGKPDPKVTLLVDGEQVASCDTASDTFETTCHPSGSFHLGPRALVVVRVIDTDIAEDDPVGDARLDVAGASLDEPLTLAVDGQLEAVTMTLARGHAPPFWTAGRVLLAIVIFVVAAGVGNVLLEHRRARAAAVAAANAPPMPPPKQHRCPYCTSIVAPGVARCEHCGGKL